MGFPQNSFSKIESICKEKNLSLSEENNQIKITGHTSFTVQEFISWKNNIALIENESLSQSPRSRYLKENELLEKIRNFSVISKTPN